MPATSRPLGSTPWRARPTALAPCGIRHSEAPVAAAKSPAAARRAAACGWFSATPPTITTARLAALATSRNAASLRAPASCDGATMRLPAMLKAKSKSTGLTTCTLAPLRTALRMRWCSSGNSWRIWVPNRTMTSACSISASGSANGSATAPSEKSRLLMRWSRLPVPRPSASLASRPPSSFDTAGCTSTPRLSPRCARRISAAADRPSAQDTSRHSPLTFCSGFTARSSAYRPWCE